MLQGASISRIIQVANHVGVFEAIADGRHTPQALARRTRSHLEGITRLCNALAALEILKKQAGQYTFASSWKMFLTRKGKHSLTGYMDLHHDTWEELSRLEKTVRTGKPVRTAIQRIKKDPIQLKNFIHGMHRRAVTASALVEKKIGLKKVRRMLDIGAGPGTYSLEWALRHPQLHAVVFDLKKVIPVTRTYIRRYGLGRRVTTRAGDFHLGQGDLGQGYDLALLANILQMYGEEDNIKLLARVFTALDPGGRIIINGFFTDQTGTRPREAALFAMFIATAMPSGNAHATPRVLDWLKKSGFEKTRTFEINGMPRTVIVATKPTKKKTQRKAKEKTKEKILWPDHKERPAKNPRRKKA